MLSRYMIWGINDTSKREIATAGVFGITGS